MKQQLAQSSGGITNYANPTANLSAIQNTGLAGTQSNFNNGSQTGNNQALLAQAPQKDQQQLPIGLGIISPSLWTYRPHTITS